MADNQKDIKMPIRVNFQSEIIHANNEREQVSFNTVGQYYIKGQSEYIVFAEELERQEKVHCFYKINNQEVRLKRSGDIKMSQSFRAGETTEGSYHGAGAIFQFETETNKVILMKDPNKNRGSLQLDYKLKIQDDITGQYLITINFEEE
ncbi:DUF1934 domain-containing protein [Sutcliffiella rhizosphaerae]|uniref:Beta-barrel protein YwiB n=1 Tax=Sutcliffiella rhizosphaerae TaxID=2880967 RepID=A0ABM8YJM8_9BACI|nr:DUF1934 domain-containing protein [Sutcliffiella rhizosphaerae]CAG9620091.1 putative beta-barrel protein YwiB [Sutcliffiella rhizosphaerae]